MYKLIKEVGALKFGNCDGCQKNCCTPNGGFSLAPLILDDFSEVYEKFPILFAYVGQVFKVVIILNNGKDNCIYFNNDTKLCSIYDSRPPACIMYPISPLFDDICVDVSCKAVGQEGDFLCDKDGFSKTFYHKRVDDFYLKLRRTQKFLNQLRFNVEKVTTVVGIDLFKYDNKGEYDEEFQEYINMHHKSLNNVKNYI
jgi:Fe-S-cluster containining protein